jgi:ATP-dependent protease ClpP protease subunit
MRKSAVKKRMSDISLSLMEHKHELLLDYSVDIDQRVITVSGEIEEGWFDFIDSRASLLEKDSTAAITLRLNSQGGNTYEAMAVVGRLRASSCKFHIEAYGHVMSAATLILACGHKRKMSKYAWLMHHGSYWGMETTRHAEAKERVKQNEREETLWNQWMAEFTGKEAGYWEKWSQHRDLYMTAEQALAAGVIDEII